MPRARRKNPADRLWSQVRKSDGCWEWTGHRDRRSGYGHTGGGLAHRLSWEIHFGAVPAGMRVCHHCDNPPCVRPDHLFLGTAKHNSADMVRKGRSPRGEKQGQAKLTESDVRAIRAKRAAGMKLGQIAGEHGVTLSNVAMIVTRQTWRHVA